MIGTKLAHYEITGHLGTGGMGEVYQAKDGKLGRSVAIKLLPESFTFDTEHVARFAREARVLASLNHSNIAAIYGVEESGGRKFLVMELVPGETLAERIKRGRVPVDEALQIARQIAEALEAAHDSEKGIVHRDLKPANVKITPGGVVKLLDFGLAKATENGVFVDDPSAAPTLTHSSTLPGTIVGTAAYMSPEQASGSPVDKRSDVWAFGVVLWEMLTGSRLFDGDSVMHILASVLRAEIDFSRLPGETPAPIRELLMRCLDRDPKSRLRDLGEARVLLQRYLADRSRVSSAPKETTRRPGWIGLIASALAVASVATAAVWIYANRSSPVPGPEQWKQITDFPDAATNPALSPDGHMLAFTRGTGWFMGNNEIYVKLLPDGPAVPLTSDGTAKMFPTFSADGSRVAYTAHGTGFDVWTVPVLAGERPRLMRKNAEGLTWVDPQRVLFSQGGGGIAGNGNDNGDGGGMGIETALEDGGSQREIYLPKGGMAHFSSLSPDKKQVLVVEMVGTAPWIPCRLLPFDGSSTGREVGPRSRPRDPNTPTTELPAEPAQCTAAAWSPDGKWMYFTANEGQGSHIWRQRVNSDKPEQITAGLTEEQGLAVAPDGKSLYTSVGAAHSSIWIHDAKGERQISGEGSPGRAVFSVDGKRVYYRVRASKTAELWVTDVETGRSKLALPATTPIAFFTLSPDGKSVLYGTTGGQAFVAPLDAATPPHPLAIADSTVVGGPPVFWAVSGRLYFPATDGGKKHYYTMKLDGSDRRQVLPDSAFANGVDWRFVQVSPDERWVSHEGIASPIAGGPPTEICACDLTWSADGNTALFVFRSLGNGVGSTVAVPLKAGEMFPLLPPGRHTFAEFAKVPGAIVIPASFPDVGPGMSAWVYTHASSQQNIFQIPLH